jgi:hypothetical protein
MTMSGQAWVPVTELRTESVGDSIAPRLKKSAAANLARKELEPEKIITFKFPTLQSKICET